MKKVLVLLKGLLDFILPESRFAKVAKSLSRESLLEKARPRLVDKNMFVLFHTKDSLIKKSIWALKYYNQKSLGDVFGSVLYEHILDELVDELLFEDFSEPLLVPIPLSPKRLRERGYNQSELIAKSLCTLDSSRSFVLCSDALVRIKETESQARMYNRKSREVNMKDAFQAKNRENIKDRNIILLDDVITTGATMREARETLLRAGARNVYCIALAN